MTATGVPFEEFRREVVRFEAEAAADPERYRSGMAGFAILGYAYLIGLAIGLPLVAVLAVVVLAETHLGVFAAKLLIPIVVLWVTLVRALWVRLPEPSGLPLTAAQAPALFELIAELSRRLKAPAPDVVLVTEAFNASIVQHPMLSPLAGYRNYLVLGWPLLQALSAEQFRSVLAHEFGHLSGNHGGFASWIYRQRTTWAALRHQLEGGGKDSRLAATVIGRFARWYEPKFAARSFVLARSHEYEADRCAVELTSALVAAGALVRVHGAGAWVEKHYLGSRLKEGEATPEAPADLFTRLGTELGQPLPAEEVQAEVSRAWSTPTDYHDTHPALADRLRGMGIERLDQVESPAVRPGPAAGPVLLGEVNDTAAVRLDQLWREHAGPGWKARSEEAMAARGALATLASQAGERTLTEPEAWQRVRLTYHHDGAVAAEPLATAYLADHPDHPGARFMLGQAMLERGDDAGVAHLRAAMAGDPDLGMPGNALLFDFFWSQGRIGEAEAVRRVGEEVAREAEAVAREMGKLDASTVLLPHELPAVEVEKLRGFLAKFPEVMLALLARREPRTGRAASSFVLVLVMRRPWFSIRSTRPHEMALRQRILSEAIWPENTYAFVLGPEHKKLVKRFRAVPGVVLVERK
jgi:Zn-dependent protease with chaperone function